MKTINYKNYLTCICLIALLAGCKKAFLERLPEDTFVDANFYKTTEQVLSATAPLYNKVWFDYNDKASHGIGDARGGIVFSHSYQAENIRMSSNSVTPEVSASWQSFYNIVAQSNSVIINVERYAGPDVPDNVKKYALSEGHFMRGMAYSYLVQNWGPIPVITNNSAVLLDTAIRRNTIESVWRFIIADFQYAVNNLPTTSMQPGRLNKWAAEGMLAKMYLTRAGVGQSNTRKQSDLDSAKLLTKDVIDHGGYSLMPNVEDLYLTRNNNNPESIFALQWKWDAADYGSQNSVQAYLAFGSAITGFPDGWGGDIGASKYILDKYSPNDKRRRATFMMPGEHYSYIHQDAGGGVIQELQVPVSSTDSNAIKYGSLAWVKKYVVGRPEDNDGQVKQQRTAINTYMLRFAEVYLIYADAVLGNQASTADALALLYFNKVRARAGLAPLSSITEDDILNERLLELAMEGQAWYDFVRLHYYKPQKAYNILSSQDRGYADATFIENYRIYPNTITNATSWDIKTYHPHSYTVSDANFYLPLPASELTIAPNLLAPAVPYVF
jgi:hypothetical protein